MDLHTVSNDGSWKVGDRYAGGKIIGGELVGRLVGKVVELGDDGTMTIETPTLEDQSTESLRELAAYGAADWRLRDKASTIVARREALEQLRKADASITDAIAALANTPVGHFAHKEGIARAGVSLDDLAAVRGRVRLALDLMDADDAPANDDAGECEGHPAGPYDPMGATTYCDGSCRG